MSLNLSKPVQTRDGRPARIICTDMKADWPIIALVVHRHSPTETAYFFSKNGSYIEGTQHPFDLINVPKKHAGRVNVFSSNDVLRRRAILISELHQTKADADHVSTEHRIACIEISFTEGEGL